MASIALTEQEQRWLSGADGAAHELAMRLMVTAAEVSGATEFVAIDFAHLNASFYSGQVSVDFAEFLLAHDATFAVPTHTNASLIDCSTPDLRPADEFPVEVAGATRLMEIYEQLGATSMWTCAPYLQPETRPALGAQIAGSESNAVSFYNSALGARTNKYGDFLDVCAAITGRVPLVGLHTDEGRHATHRFDLSSLSDAALADPTLPHVLGIIIGEQAGTSVPVIDGLPEASEDDLKAIAAAGGTSGAVEMFHVVGVTPEAPTLDAATGGQRLISHTDVTSASIADARRRLSTARSGPLRAICLGAPHFTITEFADLRTALAGRPIDPDVTMLVTTSRAVGNELTLRGWNSELEQAGVEIALDTCSYYTPRPRGVEGLVMTNSAKWAYYAPGILDVEVAFGSLAECVEAAVTGKVYDA